MTVAKSKQNPNQESPGPMDTLSSTNPASSEPTVLAPGDADTSKDKRAQVKDSAPSSKKGGEGEDWENKFLALTEEKISLEASFKELQEQRAQAYKDRQKLWEEFQMLKTTLESVKDKAPSKENLGITADTRKLSEEKTALEAKVKEQQEERSQIIKDRQKLWEEYQKVKVARDELRERLNAKDAEEKATKEESLASQKLVDELEQKNILISQLSISIEDQKKQNELILFQVHQTKDDINNYWTENVHLKGVNANLNARWKRLQAKFPDYVDYGSVQIISDDSLSDAPQLVWKVSDFLKDDISFAEFYFATTLADGNIGISLRGDLADKATRAVFMPSLVGVAIDQTNLFYGFTREDWKKLQAAALILEQINFNAAHTIPGGEGVDFGFWRGSLKTLVAQIKDLKPTVRFNEIKLKRELKNPDYEHLWLEFSGVDFNGLDVPKLELRLGAAMIQPDGFSRHPKLEFPLTDGKHKPFESWFAETQDDFGAKYELRFDLDKVAFDYTTWLKIAEKDRLFLEELITAVPSALERLRGKQVSVSRNWNVWIDFANELVQIFNKQLILIKGRVGSNQTSRNSQANIGNTANGVARSATPSNPLNPLNPSTPQVAQFNAGASSTTARQMGGLNNPFASVPIPSSPIPSTTTLAKPTSNSALKPALNSQGVSGVNTSTGLPNQGNEFQAQQFRDSQEYQQSIAAMVPGVQIASGVTRPARGGVTGSGPGAQTSYRELSSNMSVTVTRKASVAKSEKPVAVKKKTTTSTPVKKSTKAR